MTAPQKEINTVVKKSGFIASKFVDSWGQFCFAFLRSNDISGKFKTSRNAKNCQCLRGFHALYAKRPESVQMDSSPTSGASQPSRWRTTTATGGRSSKRRKCALKCAITGIREDNLSESSTNSVPYRPLLIKQKSRRRLGRKVSMIKKHWFCKRGNIYYSFDSDQERRLIPCRPIP